MSYFEYKNTQVYYKLSGNGFPVIFLHGNTSSSKMFLGVVGKFSKIYKTIRVDFPGHGKSERISEFPVDWWFENAAVIIALIRHLKLPKVHIIGSSGGALIALNIALEHPQYVNKIVADSFIGEYSQDDFINSLNTDRQQAMKSIFAKLFWRWNHGPDWRNVVRQDTIMQTSFHKKYGNFFHQPLSGISVPVLLIGSKEDEFVPDIEKKYGRLSANMRDSKVHIFQQGNHPSIMSNSKRFFKITHDFLKE